MKIKYVYLILCAFGLILPYYQMMNYTIEHGSDYGPLFTDIFRESSTAFFAYDLFVAALVGIVFMFAESRRLKIKNVWIPILCTILIGFAFGLPLFMYLRERRLEKK